MNNYNTMPGGAVPPYSQAYPGTSPPGAYAQATNFSPAPIGMGASAPVQPGFPGTVNFKPHEAVQEQQARAFLTGLHWPPGLVEVFIANAYKIAFRVFICDDSGSMEANDGNRLIDVQGDSYGNRKLINCSRWAELTDALKFHANVAHAASTPTEFRLLNNGTPIIVGNGNPEDRTDLNRLMTYFQQSPTNGTPLCRHIREVIAEIKNMEHHLRSTNQKALVVIATDGEASDGNLAEAMRPLKSLPVWVVVRLCTNDDNIVNYWNNMDKELELDMDVLDDLCGEASAVRQFNNWLNYGEPLHRMREFGCAVKELDLLDEKKLSLEQVRKMCAYIYGGTEDSYPHPAGDWNAFVSSLTTRNKEMRQVWNPTTKKAGVWVDIAKLGAAHKKGSGACTIM